MGREWVEQLEERKREEAMFHDLDRAHDPARKPGAANRRFYAATAPVEAYVSEWTRRHVEGKVFLDYACGNGRNAIRAAQQGAALAIGIDISEVSVENARRAAAEAAVADRCLFLQRDCEDTGLPAGAIDVCVCSSMLHHLDLDRAYPELARILAPDGRILGHEALAYNPLIQLYRALTPQLRTAWETQHILSLGDVRKARRWFRVGTVRYFLMTAPVATLLPDGAIRRVGLGIAHRIDVVLTRLPLLNRLSWQFTFELINGERAASRAHGEVTP
ncbi:MAG TPA: class I SAM-dependent methyltransferase [Gemmatimonadaceae bacterium]|nr:class I SAM-dependent methyltransferase [Gemmatimonadaceae bacterium]